MPLTMQSITIVAILPITLPLPSTPVDIGGLITDPIPNSIPVNVGKNRTGANVTVLYVPFITDIKPKQWPVCSMVWPMKAVPMLDLSLDEQYTTLTKRHFQTQLAIMVAYLRADALNAIRATYRPCTGCGADFKIAFGSQKALADAEYENMQIWTMLSLPWPATAVYNRRILSN